MVLKLKVTAGPDIDHQTTLYVNDEEHPLDVTSKYFDGRILVRVRDFKGLTPHKSKKPIPTTPYFEGNKDQFSIQIQGRFKSNFADDDDEDSGDKYWTAEDIVFGNEFERPLRLPPFSSIALAVAKRIDPGLNSDLFSDKPWAFSPFFVTMNVMDVVRGRKRETISSRNDPPRTNNDGWGYQY